MRRWQLALGAGLTWLVCMGSAQADRIDDIVVAEMKRQHVPGVAIAVVRNGRIVKERGYGVANIEHQAPVTPRTVFQSGSVGKMFTASLALLLVEDGKLRLDEPISTYLPEVPASWAGITARRLMAHTAGLSQDDPAMDLRRDYTEDALLLSITKLPLRHAPGQKWSYSDLGYQVLGILCSRIGGGFYGEQLRERVFVPSGMGTRVISERDIIAHRAAGYDRDEGVLFNHQWVAPMQNTTGDGSLYLTAGDLARWSIALDGDKVLGPSAKTLAWTQATLDDGSRADYGLGWALASNNGLRLAEHGGAWQGFSSHFIRFLDDGLTVVVLTNRSRAQPQRMAENIAALFLRGLKTQANSRPSAATLASVPMFVRGGMNGWGLRDRMQAVASTVHEARVTLDVGAHEFKLGSHDWSAIDFGAPFEQPATALGQAKALDFKGDNLKLNVPRSGLYVFRLDVTQPLSPQLSVTRQNDASP